MESDGVVLASPNYIFSVSAQLMIYRKDEWPFEYEYWKNFRKL
jgi:multimeric flavodoxin WrbA